MKDLALGMFVLVTVIMLVIASASTVPQPVLLAVLGFAGAALKQLYPRTNKRKSR